MKIKLTLLLLLLFIALNVHGGTSSEARLEVQKKLLQANESVEISPVDVRIGDGHSNYWIATILSDNKIVFFTAIDSSNGILVKIGMNDRAKFSELFKASYILRNIEYYRVSGRASPTTADIDKLTIFLNSIESQKNQIDLIKSDKALSSEVKTMLSDMSSQLTSLKEKTIKITQKISEIIELRDLVVKANAITTTSQTNRLKTNYESFNSLLDDWQELKNNYSLKRDQTKLKLFNSDLDESKKANYGTWLFSLNVNDVDRFKQDLTVASNAIIKLFNYSAPASIFSELENRQKSFEAVQELEGFDETFKSKTKNVYDNLKTAWQEINYYSQNSIWANGEEFIALNQNYEQASKAINDKDYIKASELIKAAKINAINVLTDGFEQPTNTVNYDEIFRNLILIVVILSIVIIIIKYRKNIGELLHTFAKKSEDEET